MTRPSACHASTHVAQPGAPAEVVRRTCACCGYRTLGIAEGGLCPVCAWQDDAEQASRPDRESGPNGLSLRQAQRLALMIGSLDRAGEAGATPYTRDPSWKPLPAKPRRRLSGFSQRMLRWLSGG